MNFGKFLVLFAATLVIPFSSFAGDEICNGGDVVVCANQPIRLLDIIERGALYGLSAHPDEPFLSWVRSYQYGSHFEGILSSVKTLDPNTHQCLNSYITNEKFWSEIRFVKSTEFKDVKDENTYVVPTGCTKVQAVIQCRRMMPFSDSRYMINDDIWMKMDDYQRAALVLHEIVLRNYILNPKWDGDTKPVRYLTGLLTSAEMSDMTSNQFDSILKDISFTCTPYK